MTQEKLNDTGKEQKLETLDGILLGHLPWDLVCNIFFLLPAETLEIASLVCKRWFNLIKSSYFIDAYARKSHTVLVFLGTSRRSFFWKKSSTTKSISMGYKISFLEIRDGMGKVTKSNELGLRNILATTCDGLILGSLFARTLVVVNPATKKAISFPVGTTTTYRGFRDSYGLVFSHLTRDYKVIHLFSDKVACHCEIFSLSQKSWRAVNGPSGGSRTFYGNPVEAFQSLHWLSQEYSTHTLSMRVDDETFFKIKLPTTSGAEDRLVEIRECLAFVSRKVRCHTIDIWTLSGLMQGKEWEKKHAIVIPDSLRDFSVPICTICFGRELVFQGHGRSSIYTYDLETKTIRMVEMENETNNCGHGLTLSQVFPHSNTLASWDSCNILHKKSYV